MSLVERVANVIRDQGWTCEYHEPDSRCDACTKLHRATAQAVLEGLGFVTCQTCGGKGRIYTEPNDPGYTCPDCHGLGVVPSEAMIERAWSGLIDNRGDMRLALLEAFGGDE